MFGTKNVDENPTEAPPEAAPAPVEKPPAREARCFQPSTFASRKAAADVANAELSKRRLVSMGLAEFTQRNTRTSEIEAIEVEMFFDRDHPRDRFAMFPGPTGGLVPLQGDAPPDQVQSLAPVKGRRLSRPAFSAYPEALIEPPPRPV